MAKETLFAILSRSPWWLSILIAAAMFAAVRLFLPDIAALFAALPFIGIGGYALWRELRVPGSARVADILGRVRTMGWADFSPLIAAAFQREGYRVTEIAEGAADFELCKGSRVSLVCCRRWKAAHTGAGPLRELYAAKEAHEAHECIYIAAGDFSDNARAFATEKGIKLLDETGT